MISLVVLQGLNPEILSSVSQSKFENEIGNCHSGCPGKGLADPKPRLRH